MQQKSPGESVILISTLINTSTGDSTFIVLEKDNKSMKGSEDNLLMVSARDLRTGRRYVKNLEAIHVGRAA